MKQILVGAVALLLGLLLGAIYPLTEVRALRAEVAELQSQDCGSHMGTELARVFRGDVPVGPESPPSPATAEEEEDTEAASDLDEAHEGLPIELGGEEQDLDPEDVDETVRVAREAMELRRVQARAALVEEAWPDEEQLDAFDGAVADMNEDLYDLTESFLATVAERDPTRRETMSYAADVLDVLIEADAAMEGALDPEQVEAAPEESLDPFSYVDPGLIDLLMELEQ